MDDGFDPHTGLWILHIAGDARMEEHLPRKQERAGSTPVTSSLVASLPLECAVCGDNGFGKPAGASCVEVRLLRAPQINSLRF